MMQLSVVMSKRAGVPLEKALTRTYWSVDDAMYYLAFPGKSHSNLLGVGRATEACDWLPDELYSLWCDTDHSQKPRNSASGFKERKAEFKVTYYIQWARSKGLRVSWLDWAIAKKFLPQDIRQQPLIESDNAGAISPTKLHHKTELTFLRLIAALMHQCKIDWTSREANYKLRELLGDIKQEVGEDTVRKVLTQLENDETIYPILESLRKKIKAPLKR